MWTPDPDADELRLRTERFLLACDAWSADGALALALELGILGPEEVRAWQARAERAQQADRRGERRSRPPAQAAGPLPAAARERLEALARELEALGPAGSDSDAWWAIQAEAGVLQQVGLLCDEEADAWDERASRAVGLTSRARHRAEVAAAARARAELLEVWIGGAADGPLHLVEARRFHDAVELHVLGPADWDPYDDAVLADDAGTAYERHGGAGSGRAWELEFRPAPPSAATRLRLSVGAHAAEVALR